MTYELALQSAWPLVVPVARAELRRFDVSHETVEDLIQEAAAVVLRKRPPFEAADDLAPYVRIVVRRLALHWLRDHKRETVGPVPDRPVLHGVPELVEGRLRLAGAAHALASLPPGQRAFFAEYLADRDTAHRADGAARKQVQRLRMAMAKVADGFAAALGWLRLRFPWLDAMGTPAVAAGFAITAVLGFLVPAQRDPADAGVPDTTVIMGGTAAAVPSVQTPPDVPLVVSKPREPAREAGSRPAASTVHPSLGPSEVQERLRVEPPVGPAVGWERRPNEPDRNLACVGTPVLGRQCVKEPDLSK